jgi:hypothetical protein
LAAAAIAAATVMLVDLVCWNPDNVTDPGAASKDMNAA